MKYVRVRNLGKWQAFRSRRPPWVKLWRSLLDDPDFAMLTDVQRWHFCGLLLVAADQGNVILAHPRLLGRQACCDGDMDLDALVAAGFVEVMDDAEAAEELEARRRADDEVRTTRARTGAMGGKQTASKLQASRKQTASKSQANRNSLLDSTQQTGAVRHSSTQQTASSEAETETETETDVTHTRALARVGLTAITNRHDREAAGQWVARLASVRTMPLTHQHLTPDQWVSLVEREVASELAQLAGDAHPGAFAGGIDKMLEGSGGWGRGAGSGPVAYLRKVVANWTPAAALSNRESEDDRIQRLRKEGLEEMRRQVEADKHKWEAQ